MGSESRLMWDTWFVSKKNKSCYNLSGGIAPETNGDGLCFLSNRFNGMSDYNRLAVDISSIVQSEEASGTFPSDLFGYFDLYEAGTTPAMFVIKKDNHDVLSLATGIIHIDSVLVSVEIPYYYYGSIVSHDYTPITFSLRHLQVNFTDDDTWTKKEVVKEVRLNHFQFTNGMSSAEIRAELSSNARESTTRFGEDVFHELFHCVHDGGRIIVSEGGESMSPVHAKAEGQDTNGSVTLTFMDISGSSPAFKSYTISCNLTAGSPYDFNVNVY